VQFAAFALGIRWLAWLKYVEYPLLLGCMDTSPIGFQIPWGCLEDKEGFKLLVKVFLERTKNFRSSFKQCMQYTSFSSTSVSMH